MKNTEIQADVKAIIEAHQSRPTETNIFFGADTVTLTTRDGLTELRRAIWENAGAIAWRLLQARALEGNGRDEPRGQNTNKLTP